MKKGQAALEFLTTYGWMFLVVLAVIGAMLYFGLGDARSSIPSSCFAGQGFECGATYVSFNGTLALEIKNLQGKTINITKVQCLYPHEAFNITTSISGPESVLPSESVVVLCSPSQEQTLGAKEKFLVNIVYNFNESGALSKVAQVELIESPVSYDARVVDSYQQEALIVS